MKYKAHLTIDFEFEVPGDDPEGEFTLRNVDTASPAAEVMRTAADKIGATIARFDNPAITISGEAVE